MKDRLHTEVLEEKYGKISLQVLHDDDELREVLLTDAQDIVRTYAVTIRSEDWRNNTAFCAVNEAIRAGEPIGRAFKSRGYAIQKKVLTVYQLALPEWLRHAFVTEENFAKARITEFLVEKAGMVLSYGFVTEVYSPDFRKPVMTLHDLAQINCTPAKLPMVMAIKQRVSDMLSQIAPVLLFF